MLKIDQLLAKWEIKCIIFDLDGTLVDTLDKHIKAFQILFEKMNLEIAKNKISQNMGRTPKDILLTLIPEIVDNQEKLEHYAAMKEAFLSQLLEKDAIKTFPGSKDLIEWVRRIGIITCVASSTPQFNVLKILENAGFEEFFDVIITGNDISIGKPNPQVFLEGAKKAFLRPEKCLVIGDSVHDILAAKKAGMRIIAVATGKHSKRQLEAAQPDQIISSLEELLV